MMHTSIWFWCLLIAAIVASNNAQLRIGGTTANGWEFVRDLFRDNFEKDRDLGGSIAVYYQGKLVVDLWGGWFNQSKTKPYDNDTLQLVFSTSKGLTATAVALCVQRGLLNYSALVTDYWPEYAHNGKGNTTVADIMSHRAGLANDSSPFEQYLNWTAMIHKLEQESPQWPPGTAHGYHALTYGWLAGELVRRVDPMNRTVGQFILDEIAKPLEIEFYIGLPTAQLHRVSPLDVKSNGTPNQYDLFNQNRTYQAEIPAANGITNARSVARLYASLIDDVEGTKYKRLLNEATLKQATKSNTPANENDLILNIPTQISMGYFLMDQAFSSLGPGVFGHNGLGGSIGFAAPAKKLSFAYVMNRMGPEVATEIDPRYSTILNEIATMINNNTTMVNNSTTMANNNGASLGSTPYTHLFLLITAILSIKFNFY